MTSGRVGGAPSVGIAGIGSFVPAPIVTAEELAAETGIPTDVLRAKFGVRQVHRAGPDCHISQMAAEAGVAALRDADVRAEDIDLLVYCGSEFKDFIVWSAAIKIAHLLGCHNAQAFEVYALCAGTPITLRVVRDMMVAEPSLRTALVVAASKESALVDRHRKATRFMFTFGDGAAAAVLRRGLKRNVVLSTASLVDGSLSEAAIMPAGGSRQPATAETVAANLHVLDVPDLGHMRARLDEVSGPNFLHVVREAMERSGRRQIDFLAPVHMKRSMHDWLCQALHAERAVYLEEYGHMQSVDQLVGLDEGRRAGLLRDGDTAVLAAAGVGYSWAASVVAWGPQD